MTEASSPNPNGGAELTGVHAFLKAVAANLREGARVAYFRPFSGAAFHVGAWHMLALALIDVLITIVYDYISIEPERYFSAHGFMAVGTSYLLFVFAVFAIASILSDKSGTPKIVVIIFSTAPAVSMVLLPLLYAYLHAEQQSLFMGLLIFLVWLGWTFVIVGRVLGERYQIRKARIAALVLLFMFLTEGPFLLLDDMPFWYSYNPEDYAEPESVNTEEVYYAQRELLERSAQGLEEQRPGVTDLYFVGFGSYADQDVFMNEVTYVRDLFDTRFDTGGRSVVLINNEKTVATVPLANRSNLGIMLRSIAERMDTEEDVLFLFLTSHGSDDAVLSVDFWPLDPNDLSADDLQQALAHSGIKWRILVISACYSGSFIEPLRDEHTLILTAADKDKTSFGCSNDRAMTYFGEHYFATALAETGSFVDAFEDAKSALRAREIEEKIDASEPQMYMGNAMQAKLAELQARLESKSATMARAPAGPSSACDESAQPLGEGLAAERDSACVAHDRALRSPQH